MLFAINPDNPQARLTQQVVAKLKNGAVICYPTDTGYGIGCDIFNAKAVKRIMQIKHRPANKPFSFVCSDLTHISLYAHVSNTAYRLLKKCLPGPYTFVLPGSKLVPKLMLTRQKTVGIRVPDNGICRMLIEELGNPLVNTSLPPNDADQTDPSLLHDAIGHLVDVVIAGGLAYTEPSSVIDLTAEAPEIIREGKGDISLFL
jgi:tRNA threonylcarbamoyl adenosine modification protein (Sua5/YciO/YrdC/YwlC family)